MKFQKPKGTTDYYPEEKSVQQRIFELFRETARRYNFKEIESPVFESLELLTKKEGDEIKEQIFVLTKRSKESLGLRFDLTVPAVRMFIEKQKVLPKPVKWFYVSRMWRYEQPQAGRDREFYQFSAEIFGSNKPEADAEIINLAIDSLLSLGLDEKDFIVKINNRKFIQSLLLNVVEKQKLGDVLKPVSYTHLTLPTKA